MSFWSGQKLRDNLKLIIENPCADHIDCAAYTLHVGPEIYITPHSDIKDPHTNTKRPLIKNEAFTIPAGQFAYILTEETIIIPEKNLGFISVKATTKFKGLVNVSGFHVDPGWKGRLIFSVYNAGPAPIHLERGGALFLLWIADLDNCANESDARNTDKTENIPSNMSTIPTKLIQEIPGTIHSLQSLSKRIDKSDKKLDRINTEWRLYAIFLLLVLGILLRGPIFDEVGNLMQRANPTIGGEQDSRSQTETKAKTTPQVIQENKRQ